MHRVVLAAAAAAAFASIVQRNAKASYRDTEWNISLAAAAAVPATLSGNVKTF